MSSAVVVVPCFNEEARLDGERIAAYAAGAREVSLLFVDDGSRDGTRRVLEALRDRCPGAIDCLPLEQNGGKAEAVRRGILAALDRRPDLVGFWDADLATPLEVIDRFREILDLRPELLAVIGSRVGLLGRSVDRKAVRHAAGRVFATAASWALGTRVYDTQCGAKLFRADGTTRSLFAEPFLARWVFDVEILARLGRLHREGKVPPLARGVREEPLEEWHDAPGSKVKWFDFFAALKDLVRIRRRYR